MAVRQDTQQNYQQLMEMIKANKLKPVCFIGGDEQFFIDRIQEAILANIPPEIKDFNLDILYGQDVDISKILGVAKSYPMMAERRVVLIREFFNSIKTNEESRENLGLLDPLIAYIENPLESTCLILIDSKKPAKTTRFYKAIENSKKAALFEFDQIDGSQVPDWIMKWGKSHHNTKILPDAAEVLYQITGTSLHTLSTELEKICTFKKTDEPVTVEDVKSVVGFSRQFTVLELKEAVVSRNLHMAIQIAEQMLQGNSSDKGEVIRNVAFLYSVFAKIWQYQRLAQKGLSPDQMASQLGGSFRMKMIAKEARSFRPAELPAIFETLLDTDKSIKGFSKMDDKAAFIMMLRRIIA
jgi:DNA polymerase-3 subunit delta